MSKDTIYRQAAIDALNDDAELLNRALDNMYVVGVEREKYAWGLGLIESYISDMKELPSAEPEQNWIPCSERLPKIGKYVLLSEPNDMFIAEYHGSGDPKGLWLVDGYYHYLADVNGCAWMPMPEAYKAEGDE